VNIWTEPAERAAAQFAAIEAEWPGRLHLGLGVSHAPAVEAAGLGTYRKPLTVMSDYLDALAAAPTPVPAERVLLGALGPRMVRLAAQRTLGTVPYLITADYLAGVREALADRVLAPTFPVVLDADLDRARATARAHLALYLGLPNYTRNFTRLGFGVADLADGGSDALLDAVYVVGDVDRVRERVTALLAAGADHVALTVVPGPLQYEEQVSGLAAAVA
jgi:probable F420-dependent oxidoreductase